MKTIAAALLSAQKTGAGEGLPAPRSLTTITSPSQQTRPPTAATSPAQHGTTIVRIRRAAQQHSIADHQRPHTPQWNACRHHRRSRRRRQGRAFCGTNLVAVWQDSGDLDIKYSRSSDGG
jgi:hypothetical protein